MSLRQSRCRKAQPLSDEWLAAPAARLAPAHPRRLVPHADDSGRHPGDDRVFGHVARDYRVRPDDGVVAHRHATEDAGAVADPDVVAHADVALVDALEADRAVDLDHAVVEVDQHHPVGDDALAADRDVLVAGDGALLPDDGLGADSHLALVRADLRAVADPRPA